MIGKLSAPEIAVDCAGSEVSMRSRVLHVVGFVLACAAPCALGAEREHRFSTSVKAEEIQFLFTDDDRLEEAVAWCQSAGITRVFLETFRHGYQVEESLLEKSKAAFESGGIETAGLVTPTLIGKPSSGWNVVCCFSDRETQQRTLAVFEYAVRHFDVVLVDDFWFTDCTCPECTTAKDAQRAAVGDAVYPVVGANWSAYRRELMCRLSEEVARTCRRVNPHVRLLVKFPCWYENYQNRGYDVPRMGEIFDGTWIGTETRDYDEAAQTGVPPTRAFFLARWAESVTPGKSEGAWYDPLWTTPATYLEQARMTILGGARESLLHSYGYLTMTDEEGKQWDDVVAKLGLTGVGGMGSPHGPANFAALEPVMPELIEVARQTGRRSLAGVAAYKPPNSPGRGDDELFSFLGMTGLPLVPYSTFPDSAPAACFSMHALTTPDAAQRIADYLATGRPTLLTERLAEELGETLELPLPSAVVLPSGLWRLLDLPDAELDALRAPFLKPFDLQGFRAPNKTGLVLFSDGSWVLSNFNDHPVNVTVRGESRDVAPRGYACQWQ